MILILVWMGWREPLERLAQAVWPVPFAGTVLGSFLLALFLAELARLMVLKLNPTLVDDYAGELVRLLRRAQYDFKPVTLTLDNRNIYIGFVQEAPGLKPSQTYLKFPKRAVGGAW
ncbi:MAG: hypothetical protein ACK5AZ_15155 [Bryobacteraceae bacterium]